MLRYVVVFDRWFSIALEIMLAVQAVSALFSTTLFPAQVLALTWAVNLWPELILLLWFPECPWSCKAQVGWVCMNQLVLALTWNYWDWVAIVLVLFCNIAIYWIWYETLKGAKIHATGPPKAAHVH